MFTHGSARSAVASAARFRRPALTVHSAQLAQIRLTGPQNTDVYTTPANVRTIVKWFQVTNLDTVPTDVLLASTNTSGDKFVLTSVPALAANDTAGGPTWIVLNPGEGLWVHTDATVVDVHAAGAELDF